LWFHTANNSDVTFGARRERKNRILSFKCR